MTKAKACTVKAKAIGVATFVSSPIHLFLLTYGIYL